MQEMGVRSKVHLIWRNVTCTVLCRLLVFFYILIPVVLKVFPSIFLHTVFSFKYKGPELYNRVLNPEQDWDFPGASNHYILSQSGNKIGLWHIPPSGKQSESLMKADRVIVYCHGQSGNRASGHRTSFYSTLINLGFHVVTFDYSGFGDSLGIPNGDAVMSDTASVYKWTTGQMQKPNAKVIIWGHSLGSAIAAVTLAEFSTSSSIHPPDGFVLEAPFTNLYNASASNMLFRFCNTLYPYLWEKMFKSSAKTHNMEFFTEKNILKLRTNILILHAEDDPKVPVEMSQILYESLTSGQKTKALSVQFYRIKENHHCGHNLIHEFKSFKEIIHDYSDKLGSKFSTGRKNQQYIV